MMTSSSGGARSGKALVGVLILVAAGCAPQRMAVPKDIGSVSDEIVISDRSGMSGALVDESFKIGAYHVTDVNRKWTSSSGSSIAGFSSDSTTGGYTFGLKTPEAKYTGKCASQLEEKSASLLGGMVGHQKFTVLCECGGAAAPASVTLRADTTSHYGGTLSARNQSYKVAGIYNDETGNSRSNPLGYEVRGPDAVAAVEVAGKGRVWLNKTLDPGIRADVACLFAGLLLYKQPQGKMDK